MTYNIIGLALDLIGVILLFRFGILPNNLWEHILMDSGMSENDEKRHKLWSKIAIALIFIGFSLQLFGTVLQYKSQQENPKVVNYENLHFKKKKKPGTNITSELRLKYDHNRLYYHLNLIGPSKSFDFIDEFGINLEDSEGFKIYEIKESRYSDEVVLSKFFRNDSLFITIKNSIQFIEKDYAKIDRWNLTTKK